MKGFIIRLTGGVNAAPHQVGSSGMQRKMVEKIETAHLERKSLAAEAGGMNPMMQMPMMNPMMQQMQMQQRLGMCFVASLLSYRVPCGSVSG